MTKTAGAKKQTPRPTTDAAAAARKQPARAEGIFHKGSGIRKSDKTARKKNSLVLGQHKQSKAELQKLKRLDEERHRLLKLLKQNAAERDKIEAAGAARKKKGDGGAAGASRGGKKKAPVRMRSFVLLALTRKNAPRAHARLSFDLIQGIPMCRWRGRAATQLTARARARQEDRNHLTNLLTDDIIHGALLPLLSRRGLILLSMTCKRGLQMVDGAPAELSLWWGLHNAAVTCCCHMTPLHRH